MSFGRRTGELLLFQNRQGQVILYMVKAIEMKMFLSHKSVRFINEKFHLSSLLVFLIFYFCQVFSHTFPFLLQFFADFFTIVQTLIPFQTNRKTSQPVEIKTMSEINSLTAYFQLQSVEPPNRFPFILRESFRIFIESVKVCHS